MREIAIVGAGQSGSMLAHGLLAAGYRVKLISGRTPQEVRAARPAITQVAFPSVEEAEGRAGLLDFEWREEAPVIRTARISLQPPQGPPMVLQGPLGDAPAKSVDRSVKIADWMDLFQELSKREVVWAGQTTGDLYFLARRYDLVIVAAGDSEIVETFPVDGSRSAGALPRSVAQAFVTPEFVGDEVVAFSTPFGEVFCVPVLTVLGPAVLGSAVSVMINAHVGGPLDCAPTAGQRQPTDEQMWDRMRGVLVKYLPDLAASLHGAELLGEPATVHKRVYPRVRHPVAMVADPRGKGEPLPVLGTSDLVITPDPSSFQGWANSARCADIYLDEILAHGDKPFDAPWMRKAGDRFWHEAGQPSAMFAHMVHQFWSGTLPPHIGELAAIAATATPMGREVAERWTRTFDRPSGFGPWLLDGDGARAYLADLRSRHPAPA